ncbi:hypothetical protein C0991_008082 [Blastosporella zonata]|nr:hypothetical protein C0991_008082 [Blastosporella zonata]
MHRLPRQVLRLRTFTRVARVQRPPFSSSASFLFLGRHYASKNGPRTPQEKFDRLLDSCGPELKQYELAKRMAALEALAGDNEALLDRMSEKLGPLIEASGEEYPWLARKMQLYASEPPKDNYDELVEKLDDCMYIFLFKKGSLLTSEAQLHARIVTPLPLDPSLEHPLDTLMDHLCTEEMKAKIDALHSLHQRDIFGLWKDVLENSNDMREYIQMAELLEEHGMPITYKRRLPLDMPAHTPEPVSVPTEEVKSSENDGVVETPNKFDKGLPEWLADAEELIRLNEKDIAKDIADATEDIAEEHPELAANFAAELAQDDVALQPLDHFTRGGSEPAIAGMAAEEATTDSRQERSFQYPNLMSADPLLDSRDVLELPPDGKTQKFHNRVIIRNHSSIFHEAMAEQGFDFNDDTYVPTRSDETEESATSSENLPLSPDELKKDYYRFPLIHRRIVQQTGKGKIPRMYCLMVVGNGNGMVGLGQGKDEDVPRAERKAFAQAVRNMDWVERFENRTIWTDMETKLGSTQIILRPRPVGFGLRCNPKLHQVLKAAGIKDISAKVWGSRNPINVIKAAFRLLQAGHAPLGMGDGLGGPGRKLNKGSGLRSKDDVERERGRPLISLRK